MKQYLLSIYQPEGDPPEPEIMDPIMRDLEVLGQEMRDAGVWVFGAGLHPPSTATVVRAKGDDDFLITDGPYAEGKEFIGGFTVIKVPDLDAALEWGRKYARAIRMLPIEVRPLYDEAEAEC